jgi:hypothetical protein
LADGASGQTLEGGKRGKQSGAGRWVGQSVGAGVDPQPGRAFRRAMRAVWASFLPASCGAGPRRRRCRATELASVRGISPASAKRLAQRHRWARQVGNDGVVRVTVPLTEAQGHRKPAPELVWISAADPSDRERCPDVTPGIRPGCPPDCPDTGKRHRGAARAKANQWAEAEHARADRAEQRVVDKGCGDRPSAQPARSADDAARRAPAVEAAMVPVRAWRVGEATSIKSTAPVPICIAEGHRK